MAMFVHDASAFKNVFIMRDPTFILVSLDPLYMSYPFKVIQ